MTVASCCCGCCCWKCCHGIAGVAVVHLGPHAVINQYYDVVVCTTPPPPPLRRPSRFPKNVSYRNYESWDHSMVVAVGVA